jgi:hemerythrin
MFEWNDKFKVGVQKIDEQHKELFRLMKQLYDASSVGKARSVVVEVLKGVVKYTQEHFTTEEDLMRKYEYADYLAHKQMHDSLVKQAQELLAKTEASTLTVSIDVMKFLEGWIAHHISAADQKLGAFLLKKGVK